MEEDLKPNPNKKYDTFKFYPSSVGKCPRAIVYQMLGREKLPPMPRLQSIFDNGTAFHNRMEDVFERTGLMIAPELTIKKPELKISGRSDVIIHNKKEHVSSDTIIKLHRYDYKTKKNNLVYEGPDNDVHIIELKSINDNGFNRLKTKPQQKHADQLLLYMYITGIRVGSVLYENKNNQMLKEYYIEYDERRVQNVILKDIKFCVDCATEGKIPKRFYEEHTFECRYCDYAHICRPKSFYSRKIVDEEVF